MKCPNCHEDITDLRCFSLLWREDRFTVEQIEDGEHIKPKYEPDQICLSEPVNVEFVCPECDAKLFDNEPSAIAFLSGKIVGGQLEKKGE
jgi:hypothetical protein